MAKKIVLSNESKFDSITQILILFVLGLPAVFIFENISGNETINKVLYYALVTVIVSFTKVSKQTFIKDMKIVKGVSFFGILFNSSNFSIKEVSKVFLNQTEENYFEITIKKNDDSNFTIKRLPNKNPALAELKLIEEYIELAKNQKLN